MANAALLPIPQFLGTSYNGYTYTAYEVGTTTPKDIYKSSSGSSGSLHNNPVTLNANGSTTDGIWGSGYYDIVLKDTSGTTVFSWSNVSGGDATVSSSSSASALNPSDNFVANSQFNVWRDGTTTLSGKADASENAASWYGLTQTGNYDASQLTTTSLATTSSAIRITNSAGSAQRLGLIQWTQKTAGDPIAANTVFGQVKVRPGTNQTIRIALIAWLAPNSTPTTDVVNNWASPTFTEGNFFISSANIEIIATSSVVGTTATWGSLSCSGTVPSNTTRIGLFVWTDSTVANSDTVDITAAAVYESTSALLWRPRDPEMEVVKTLGGVLTPLNASTSVNFGSNLTYQLTSPASAKVFNNTPVLFHVHRSAAQSLSDNTPTKITYNTKTGVHSYDIGGYYDEVTNNRYTPLIAGFYQFTHTLYLQDTVSTGSIAALIYKNGTEVCRNHIQMAVTSANGILAACVTVTLFMNGSTDYVEAWGYQTTAASRNVAADTSKSYFEGRRISPLTASSY